MELGYGEVSLKEEKDMDHEQGDGIKRMYRKLLPALAVFSLFFMAVNLQAASSTQDANKLHALVREMVDPSLAAKAGVYGPAPGALVRVDGPDIHFQEMAGFADPDRKITLKVDDHFEIGSNTKMFTAVLLLQLVEQGILSLDDPLSRWLPGWVTKIPHGREMTLRHLANHTSGLWDYADAIIGAGAEDDTLLRRAYTPEELVRYAIEHGRPDFLPGERGKWKYSNTGYILLGMVLEKASGRSYRKLLFERILNPLHMEETTFPNTIPADPALVQGYVSYPGGKNVTDWNLSQGWAAGGIISTAADMRIFLRALAHGKVFTRPETLSVMATFIEPEAIHEHNGSRGYGIGLIEYGHNIWGHGGQTLGFESLMLFVPGTDWSVIVLTNASQGPYLQMRKLIPFLQQLEEGH